MRIAKKKKRIFSCLKVLSATNSTTYLTLPFFFFIIIIIRLTLMFNFVRKKLTLVWLFNYSWIKDSFNFEFVVFTETHFYHSTNTMAWLHVALKMVQKQKIFIKGNVNKCSTFMVCLAFTVLYILLYNHLFYFIFLNNVIVSVNTITFGLHTVTITLRCTNQETSER